MMGALTDGETTEGLPCEGGSTTHAAQHYSKQNVAASARASATSATTTGHHEESGSHVVSESKIDEKGEAERSSASQSWSGGRGGAEVEQKGTVAAAPHAGAGEGNASQAGVAVAVPTHAREPLAATLKLIPAAGAKGIGALASQSVALAALLLGDPGEREGRLGHG